MPLDRRQALALSVGGILAGLFGARAAAAAGTFEVTRSDAEWRAALGPDRYAVLRKEATERAHSSPLNAEKRAGVFHCAGCDQALYASADKYDSGTGWPSFTRSVSAAAVGRREDRTLGLFPRTELHCSRCGGHLGHVFDDGPAPTGERHCINGLALEFKPAA
ncbi:MAG: peptide-methionine (R)-S-oxide reductase MsrB [Hyphomicrobiaceae bacterium]|nr:peptide-methionine (R)-S-oxide reductase MsrB [Hyphomicrobiaceae bacterium]